MPFSSILMYRYKEKERSFADISFQIYHDMFFMYI